MSLSLLVRLFLKRIRVLPLAQPTPPGLLLSVLLPQLPLAQPTRPEMLLSFLLAHLLLAPPTVRLRQSDSTRDRRRRLRARLLTEHLLRLSRNRRHLQRARRGRRLCL